jgi:hypothetical protein
LLVSERAHLISPYMDHPNWHAFSKQRDAQGCPKADALSELAAFGILGGRFLEIGHVDCTPIDHGAARNGPANGRHHIADWDRDRPMMCRYAQHVAIQLADPRVVGIAKAGRGLGHGVEDRLDVSR